MVAFADVNMPDAQFWNSCSEDLSVVLETARLYHWEIVFILNGVLDKWLKSWIEQWGSCEMRSFLFCSCVLCLASVCKWGCMELRHQTHVWLGMFGSCVAVRMQHWAAHRLLFSNARSQWNIPQQRSHWSFITSNFPTCGYPPSHNQSTTSTTSATTTAPTRTESTSMCATLSVSPQTFPLISPPTVSWPCTYSQRYPCHRRPSTQVREPNLQRQVNGTHHLNA